MLSKNEVLTWLAKYDLQKYPVTVYHELVVEQRPYPGRIEILGAWKTGCLKTGGQGRVFLNGWVHLANNVEKLKNREEKQGVGWFLYEQLGWSIMDSLLASHLSVILTLSGTWAYNGKKIGIEFRRMVKDRRSCVRDYYHKALIS